jgi:putative aminopeptidase FrvX
MVTVDGAPQGPGQNASELGITIAAMDSSGPFDWHLNQKLLELCRDHGIRHQRDVFRHYRSDSASAVEAGNDLRTALVCFGLDASHGWERTHESSLHALGELLLLYIQSEPTFMRDQEPLTSEIEDFPTQPTETADPVVDSPSGIAPPAERPD